MSMLACLVIDCFLLQIPSYSLKQNYACDIKFTDKSLNYSFVQSYYEKDSEIESIINFISTKVGLQPNFISLSYPNYNNCAATDTFAEQSRQNYIGCPFHYCNTHRPLVSDLATVHQMARFGEWTLPGHRRLP